MRQKKNKQELFNDFLKVSAKVHFLTSGLIELAKIKNNIIKIRDEANSHRTFISFFLGTPRKVVVGL